MQSLEDDVLNKSKEISTDNYTMSIGELVSLYRDNELEIHPEFQRLYRWNPFQKSRFIESLLLGIPIPSIFVSQTQSGSWDVVDGLQRISTILEFMGELKDERGDLVAPLILEKTKYLPNIENVSWTNEIQEKTLPQSLKLKIKRSRLDIKIILNTSDPDNKYELFDRLNTGGSIATPQEVRNCLLIMINKDFYAWLLKLKDNEDFKNCIPLSDRQIDEQYDLELIVRFICLWNISDNHFVEIKEVGKYLTDELINKAKDSSFDYIQNEKVFNDTFKFLSDTLGENSFKKYDIEKEKSLGALSISMFEIMSLGIAWNMNIKTLKVSDYNLENKLKEIWQNPAFVSKSGSGIRASSRIPLTIPLGREIFK